MPDLKLALRTLRSAPLVNLIAILSLALGIGANGAIFSLFDQMLLRALPVPEPGRLVNLSAPGPKPGSTSCSQSGPCEDVFSYPMFRDLEREQTVFAGIAAHRNFGANVGYAGSTEVADGLLVSGSYFSTLGMRPALGRLIDSNDDRVIGESRVAVLAHDYWRDRFGAEPTVVGKSFVVNGQALEIVGVAAPGFRGTTLGNRPQVYVPITLRDTLSAGFNAFDDRRSYWIYLFARLRPGVSVDEAAAALNAPYHAIINEVEAPLQEHLSDERMAQFRARQIVVTDGRKGQSSIYREARAPILMLFAVTGLVLLIACANVANLLLARAAGRGGEMAVRLSLGCGRGRLLLQLLLDSCLLALLAGAASLGIARGTLALIASLLPPDAIAGIEWSLSWPMVGFSFAVALATGVIFGLVPALQSTRVDLVSTLKGSAGERSSSRAAARFRVGLVTAQIALATTLLVASGLFTRSLANISRVDLGLDAESLITFGISPVRNGYTSERSRALFERAERDLAALPGVTSVAAALVPVLAGDSWGDGVHVEGYPTDPDTDIYSSFNEVGPGYFRTLGTPLLAGREFTRADTLGAPKVAIVNEAFAEKFGLGRDAVGRRMTNGQGLGGELDTEIVGLVRNAKYNEVKDRIPPVFFVPYLQDEHRGFINFYVRTALPAEESFRAVREAMREIDPNLPLEGLKTMPQQIRESVAVDRIITILSTAFAVLATLLAAVGLYGVLAYTISQRTREIGLRMALGADARRVRGMVLWQVGRMVLVGAVLGLAAAVGVGSLASSLLYQLEGYDPVVLVSATTLLVAVALGAGLVPALRASRVSPMRALRYE